MSLRPPPTDDRAPRTRYLAVGNVEYGLIPERGYPDSYRVFERLGRIVMVNRGILDIQRTGVDSRGTVIIGRVDGRRLAVCIYRAVTHGERTVLRVDIHAEGFVTVHFYPYPLRYDVITQWFEV